jgi:hypothetical protein
MLLDTPNQDSPLLVEMVTILSVVKHREIYLHTGGSAGAVITQPV